MFTIYNLVYDINYETIREPVASFVPFPNECLNTLY